MLPVTFLSTKICALDVGDLNKLTRAVKNLNGSKDLEWCIEPATDGIIAIRAYVDTSFAVHKAMKFDTGILMTFGGGGIYF